MVSARVCLQQGFKKNTRKFGVTPPDSELHVCTVYSVEKAPGRELNLG